MKVIEARITTQGRVGFAAREVGRLVDTNEYILNTALYYALGFASGRYVDTEFRPTYIDDTSSVADELYITPAVPVETPNYSTALYNARDDNYVTINYAAEDDPQQSLNLPKFGRERRFSHGNEFRFYVLPRAMEPRKISDQISGYARLGKKRGKVRLDTRTLNAHQHDGEFLTNHPIGVHDYESTPLGNVVSKKMRPMPIILQAKYNDRYLSIPRENGPNVKLPEDLIFLKTKR